METQDLPTSFRIQLNMKKLTFVAILIATFSPLVHARRQMDMKFQVYVKQVGGILDDETKVDSVPKVFINKGASYERITLTRGGMSRLYTYRGPAPFILYEQVVGPDGKKTYVPFAKPRVGANWKLVTLVHRPGDKEGGLARFDALNLDTEKVPVGKATFLNSSPTAAMIVINGERHVIRPGEQKVLSEKQFAGKKVHNEYVSQAVIGKLNKNGDWTHAGASWLYRVDKEPNLFMIVDRNGRYKIDTFRGAP